MLKFNSILLSLLFAGLPFLLAAQETANQAIPADKIYYGASYYPETWPRESVSEDIRHMKELSMNVVRMAEFSWSKMEPREGEYDFQWLRSIMDELHENGISVILGTPTATPPVWLWEKHPEIGQLDEDGRRKYHGARKSYDYNSQVYQHYVVRIVTEMAKALGDHPALIGWQTDNELSMKPDYSQSTKVLFQNWLREKYGTIENLNQIWATDLWSQTPCPAAGPGTTPAFSWNGSASNRNPWSISRPYSWQPSANTLTAPLRMTPCPGRRPITKTSSKIWTTWRSTTTTASKPTTGC